MNKSLVAGSLLIISVFCVVSGCSKDPEEPKQDHVFKGYERALEKAKQVQSQMDDAEEKRRKQLDEMTR